MRSLFRLRNTLYFFMVLRSVMSSGSCKVCSTAFATYPVFSCLKFLIEEFIGRRDPSSTKRGSSLEPSAKIASPVSRHPTTQGLCLGSLGYFGPSLRLVLLGRDTSALFHHILLLLLSFPLFIYRLLLRVVRSGKRGVFSLTDHLGRLAPNLKLHYLHEVGPGLALYPNSFWDRRVFLYLVHLC